MPVELWDEIPADARAAGIALVSRYEARVAALEARLGELERRLGVNSSHPSGPPVLAVVTEFQGHARLPVPRPRHPRRHPGRG
ncbi:MAG: hypothetical protein ACRC33_03895, partial [Gemmataceae bacterium]